ncbi:MAG: hypothetical protein IJR59_07435, partial [Firmicutes bacterium]|nr:hypothetical protein [Bacillota bacterium]
MMKNVKFGILGGDDRYRILKELLEADGYAVYSYCCRFIGDPEDSRESLFKKSDVIIGPIPFSRNNRSLALNDCQEADLEELFGSMQQNGLTLLFCGSVGREVKELSLKHNITVYDFFAMEEVAVKNAIPTAEGAVQTAMSESGRTIFSSPALVLGFGRCGKALAALLKGMGAKVTVACRSKTAAANIYASGFESMDIFDIKKNIHKFAFVFNTVPAMVIDKPILEAADKKTVITDIA